MVLFNREQPFHQKKTATLTGPNPRVWLPDFSFFIPGGVALWPECDGAGGAGRTQPRYGGHWLLPPRYSRSSRSKDRSAFLTPASHSVLGVPSQSPIWTRSPLHLPQPPWRARQGERPSFLRQHLGVVYDFRAQETDVTVLQKVPTMV